MARRLGLAAEEIDQVTRAAELHDIGKMAIPQAILDKPAPLDSAEWSLIEQHTVIGERILAAAPALRPVGELVRSSHERWDGKGYPDQLAGEDIALGARIIAVCDAYEAMTGGRPYRPAIPGPDALAELRRCAGSQFDPAVVEAFCQEARALADGDQAPLAEPGQFHASAARVFQ
jgi:HD-GYP domain-containing protein (c-di-GMP phosphodiesterase class II)